MSISLMEVDNVSQPDLFCPHLGVEIPSSSRGVRFTGDIGHSAGVLTYLPVLPSGLVTDL